MMLRGSHDTVPVSANDLIPVRSQKVDEWRAGVLDLAERYYRQGHADEDAGIWNSAEVYRDTYMDLCQLVERIDPRPGAATAKPW